MMYMMLSSRLSVECSLSRLPGQKPPSFVKPSHNGFVTWRQCCVIRFWPPEQIPGPQDLVEHSQLRCFPLFPHALDWRRAMEPVALRNNTMPSLAAGIPGAPSRPHGAVAHRALPNGDDFSMQK